MRGVMNNELFQYIELRGRVTVDDVVNKFGMSKRTTAMTLSRFTNYEKDGVIKHYLVHEKGNKSRPEKVARVSKSRYGPRRNVRAPGYYRIGPDWWGELRGAVNVLIT